MNSKSNPDADVARITVRGTVIVAIITGALSILGTVLTTTLTSKAPSAPKQHWLVIDGVDFNASPAPVRVIADVGGYKYSFPSSELTVGGHQSVERFPLPTGLTTATVQLFILRARSDGSVDRFRSEPIPVENLSNFRSPISVPRWSIDSSEHLSELAPMTVRFHFD